MSITPKEGKQLKPKPNIRQTAVCDQCRGRGFTAEPTTGGRFVWVPCAYCRKTGRRAANNDE